MEYTLEKVILMFFIYGFLGWCCEVIYAACTDGHFVNRGFLNGPICPIYGVGVVAVVLLLQPFYNNLPLLYIGAYLLTTLTELITGFVLEKLFHAKWWDYSDKPLNIGGYVCLPFSLVWGLACTAVVKWINPLIYMLISYLPGVVDYLLIGICGGVLIVDLTTTVAVIRNLSERLSRLNDLAAELHSISDGIGESISETTLAAKKKVAAGQEMLDRGKEKIGEMRELTGEIAERKTAAARLKLQLLLEEKRFSHKRLLDAFPNLTSDRYPESLNRLREALKNKRSKSGLTDEEK